MMGSLSRELDEAPGALHDALRRAVAPDDLDQRHDVDRVEEMKAYQSLGPRHAVADPADGQRGGVRSKNGIRFHVRGEF